MIRIMGYISLLFVLLSVSGGAAANDKCTKGNKEKIGDFMCNNRNNNEECAYDGGDCCPCTNYGSWSDDFSNEIYDMFCRDPSSGCLDPRVDMYPNCTDSVIPDIGNGWCDMANNNEGCLFDGGDCCECSRPSSGFSLSLCVDPDASCFNPTTATEQSSCINGSIEYIGDGVCDAGNNNKGCLYDGGDCCMMCTCTNGPFWRCGFFGFSCVDPDVITQEANLCVELASPIPACPVELQSEWVVESIIQAQALVKAVRCSGGSFHVTWKGKVILDETISIFNGTFLNVTSADEDSAVFGDGKSRLFAVVNAPLHLCNITLSNGNTTYGGAIAASRSRVTFEGVTFAGNVATSSGGAIFLSSQTYASFGGEIVNTTFTGNAATSGNGGALYVEGGSYVNWTGNSIFSENSCLGEGGAVSLAGESYALWTGSTTFTRKTATVYGGALCLTAGSSAVWTANAHFLGNSARFGGAIYTRLFSNATWTAASHFVANKAIYGGALLLSYNSSALWAGKTFFSANAANVDGGALCIGDGSVVTWTAESYFLHNRSGRKGGALTVMANCTAEWTAAALFSANSALRAGGAIFANYSASLSWSENTSFINNIASEGGAILVRDGVMVEWSGKTSFISNHARLNGGAVGSEAYYLKGSVYANKEISKMFFKGATSFVNNKCGANGGGMALVQSLDVSFENGNIVFSGNTAGCSVGAVFIGGTGIGTVFENVSFVENTAQIGGGVRVTASRTTITVGTDNKQQTNPTRFDGCRFVGNVAFGTGGAVDSASGLDVFANTFFEGNVAKMGGALRLAGKVSINNCSFTDNVSELGGGPAVSNVGFISNVTASNFHHNVFNCEPHAFLDFVKVSTALSNVKFTGPWSCLFNEMVLNNQFLIVQIFVDAAQKNTSNESVCRLPASQVDCLRSTALAHYNVERIVNYLPRRGSYGTTLEHFLTNLSSTEELTMREGRKCMGF